jgi:hypothetical protein
MPHNKGRNKGKKGRSNKHNKGPVPRASATQQSGQQGITGTLPTSPEKNVVGANDGNNNSDGGFYQRYKEESLRFHNWMANEACPSSKMTAVDDYRRGVDRIVEHNMNVYLNKNDMQSANLIVAPPEIMSTLISSIRLRERVAAKRFGSKVGGDLGHQYIIDVLHYCRSALQFGNRVAAVCKASDEEDQGGALDSIGGRFHALTLNDDDSIEDIDWGDIDRDIKDGNVPKYVGVEVEEEIDIKVALLKGDDRFQAMAFLQLMDDLMEAVHDQYVLLKEHMRMEAIEEQLSSRTMQLLMECAVVANEATECVNRAENEMTLDHPHLSSFYHVLALVFLTDIVAEMNKRIAKTRLRTNPHMALEFVADVLKIAFYGGSKVSLTPVLQSFIAISGLTPQYVEDTMTLVYRSVIHETGIKATIGRKAHSWLSSFKYIGGDCCMVNTQRLVHQALFWAGYDLENLQRISLSKASSLRKNPFDEDKHPARRICGDLNEPFQRSILLELIGNCQEKPYHWLPHRSHLITVLDLFQQHLNGDRTCPGPTAMTFGLHAVLISIFVIQGNGDLARLAAYSKQSFDTIFEQLGVAATSNKDHENCSLFYRNILKFSEIADYAQSAFTVNEIDRIDQHKKNVYLAFWNPFIAGEYMLYATYICSIDLWRATVNSVGQLKFALHLYNGLKIHDRSFHIPILEKLDEVFKDTKAVWVGGKPDKGSCYKVFWMSFGLNAKAAARLTASNENNTIVICSESWKQSNMRR